MMRTIATLLQEDGSHRSLLGKRILFRADLNLPVSDGEVIDEARILQHKRSLVALVEAGARVIVLSHFGRPGGKRNRAFSLALILRRLEEVLDMKVDYSPDCVGAAARWAVCRREGGIILMENTRFHEGETRNSLPFIRALSELGDIFVNDAFSVSHRRHASTEGLARVLPSYAGFALAEEIEKLSYHLDKPREPILTISGGAKIKDKARLLRKLLLRTDRLVVGGAMANVFLVAAGRMSRGVAGIDDEAIETAKGLLDYNEENKEGGCEFILPVDLVCAKALEKDVATEICKPDEVADGMFCLDVGPDTVALIEREIGLAATIIWNGPLGAYETPPFDEASLAIARRIAVSGAVSVAGGGETASVIHRAGCGDGFTHISTAGGAFLAWLEGGGLPALDALNNAINGG